jgi:hypothetical protein
MQRAGVNIEDQTAFSTLEMFVVSALRGFEARSPDGRITA